MSQKVLLSVKNLNLGFIYGSSLVNIVKNVSFDLHEKETLVIIGESGSGKSVLSKSLGNMNEKNAIITEGSIEYFSNNKQFNLRDIYSSYIEHSYVKKIKKIYKNKLKNINNQIEEVKQFAALEIKYENMIKNPKFQKNKKLEKKLEKVKANLIQINKDIHNVSFLEKEYENINLEFLRIMESIKKYSHTTSSKLTRSIRGKEIAYIFQDPSTALNPLLTIGYQIKEVLKLHCNLRGKAANNEVINLLTKVGINDPKKAMKMLPSEYSGGMRQRIVIAIALASKPKILIADEPTTALDVTVQKQIIELLLYLKKEMNLSMIFITHDLGLASIIADNINVMYSGSFIEKGSKKDIFLNPLHPYTWALIASIPQFSEKNTSLFSLEGSPFPPEMDIKFDSFAPRNNYALKVDFFYSAPMFQISPTHFVKSWLYSPNATPIQPPENVLNAIECLKEVIK